MPNYLEMLRLKNLFNPETMPSANPMAAAQTPSFQPMDEIPRPNMPQLGPQTMGPMPQPQPQEYDPVSRMKELYSPETMASDRYNNMINAYPQEQQASGKRRVGGAILGALTDLGTNLGGNKAGVKGTSVYDETTGKNKYRENVDKWKEQITPMGQAAQLERANNANERQLAQGTVNSELAYKRDDARNTRDIRTAENREARTRVYEWKTKNPGVKFNFTGPTVTFGDSTTGKVTDTGVKTGHLSDQDKADLNQKFALERIDTKAGYDSDLESQRQTGRVALIDPKAAADILVNSKKPNAGPSASQRKVADYTRARDFARDNFELAPFIKLGKGNEYRVIPPKDGILGHSGPTAEQHARILAGLRDPNAPSTSPITTPPTTPTQQTSGGTGLPNTGAKVPPVAPKGWKYVRNETNTGWKAVKQ